MYIYIYIYIFICIYIHMYIIYSCILMYTHIVYVHTYVYTYTQIYPLLPIFSNMTVSPACMALMILDIYPFSPATRMCNRRPLTRHLISACFFNHLNPCNCMRYNNSFVNICINVYIYK
jgi:hypothetical protein